MLFRSVVTDGAQGVEMEPNAQSTERETSAKPESVTTSVSGPETPTHKPRSRNSQSRAPRMLPQPVVPAETQSPDEPIAQWRAEALFDCESLMIFLGLCSVVLNWNIDPGAADDPNELPLKKGEHLDIFDKSGKWWEARTSTGRKGSAYFCSLAFILLVSD